MPRIRVVWTPERDAILTRMWEDKFSFIDIGQACGVSGDAAEKRAQRLGLPKRRAVPELSQEEMLTIVREGLEAGFGLSELARRIHKARAVVHQLAAELGTTIRNGRPSGKQEVGPVEHNLTLAIGPAFAPIPECELITIDQTAYGRTCFWPIGDPLNLETFRYCGATVERPGDLGCRYCATHRLMSVGKGTPGERQAHKFDRRAA